MVHYIALYKLKPEVTPERLEEMIRASRSHLLKIPEVLYIRSGKKIDRTSEWPFFVSVDFDSLDRMRMCHDDPIYVKFREEYIRPNITESLELHYETEPGKDIRYS